MRWRTVQGLAAPAIFMAMLVSGEPDAPEPPEPRDEAQPPRVAMGMNVPAGGFYSPCTIFADAMKGVSPWFTFNANGVGSWNTQRAGCVETDDDGYPKELPAFPPQGAPQAVRFLVNNWYRGRYRLLYDGRGELNLRVPHDTLGDKTFLTLDGTGGHHWIEIRSSDADDPLRNIRLLPDAPPGGEPEHPFHPDLVAALRPFHCLRFPEWFPPGPGAPLNWADRTSKTHWTQAGPRGVAPEYAVELCNVVGSDAWFCLPGTATEDYLRGFARMVRDTLDETRKVYVEVGTDGIPPPGGTPGGPAAAYAAMARTAFRIWDEEFGPDGRQRLVRVAAVPDPRDEAAGSMLDALFAENDGPADADVRTGCDAIAVAAWIGFGEAEHVRWQAAEPGTVSAEAVIDTVLAGFDDGAATAAAELARARGVALLVSAGGQALNPWREGEWPYDHALWDAQIHPRVGELYDRLIGAYAEAEPGCALFCASDLVGIRKSRHGSAGHLETLEPAAPDEAASLAPKYAALLRLNATDAAPGTGNESAH